VSADLVIHWRGEEIGIFRAPKSDMWYLEGRFDSNSSAAAVTFAALARQLDAKTVSASPANGIRVLLFGAADSAQTGTHALVYSLSGENLFVRRVQDEEAVDWLLSNVME
jgi:hypothetical protein